MESPASAYRRRLAENQTHLARSRRQDRWLGIAKIVVFFAGVGAVILLLHARPLLWLLLLIPFLAFVALLAAHERVLQAVRAGERVVEFYYRGLARVEDRWAGTGETGDRFLDPAHPYARDLDLFGHGSLFELLCTARTRAGEETLARWLLHASPIDEVRLRQAAVLELRGRVEFRERLFATGETVRLGVDPEKLAAWGEKRPLFHAPWARCLTAVLGAAWLVTAFWTLVSWVASGISGTPMAPFWPVLALSAVNYVTGRFFRRDELRSVEGTEEATADLDLLAQVLAIFEREPFESPWLSSLQAKLATGGIPPSHAVRRLHRIAEWLEGRHNFMVRVVDSYVFYTTQLAFAVERWRAQFGPQIRGWLVAAGEIEALTALAGYAWEHPADVLPEFSEEQPCFEAESLAHPLLPASRAVGNDLRLGRHAQLVILSGPNMSGKSTFLRGIGINVVLAQCGAPVRARRLRISPFTVGASICVLDSLQGGVSRFYAEIRRLKLLSNLADGPVPLLFLLDELLSGTNSHDRFEGTRFIVRALVRRGAVGLVTTHDLALTRIPDSLDGIASNCHFADQIEDGELRFDFRLRPGVVQTSNALKLMQSVGLEIDEQGGG